jgi:hypothetical protein
VLAVDFTEAKLSHGSIASRPQIVAEIFCPISNFAERYVGGGRLFRLETSVSRHLIAVFLGQDGAYTDSELLLRQVHEKRI